MRKSASGDLACGFSDVEMTWLLYCVSPDDLPHDLSDLEMIWLPWRPGAATAARKPTSMEHIPDNTRLSSRSGVCTWQTSRGKLGPLGSPERSCNVQLSYHRTQWYDTRHIEAIFEAPTNHRTQLQTSLQNSWAKTVFAYFLLQFVGELIQTKHETYRSSVDIYNNFTNR